MEQGYEVFGPRAGVYQGKIAGDGQHKYAIDIVMNMADSQVYEPEIRGEHVENTRADEGKKEGKGHRKDQVEI